MKNIKNIILTIINSALFTIMLLGMIFLLNSLEWYIQLLCYSLIISFFVLYIIFLLLKKEKFYKSLFTFNVVLFIVLVCFFILNLLGLFDKISDVEIIKKLILDSGAFGVLICFLMLIFQVVILPAPAIVFYLAITAVYGSLNAFIICSLATILGSVIAFLIGRFFGKKAVVWCIGTEDTEKYSKLLNDKGKVPFIMMQLLPFFPDDILCMIAGLSKMTLKFFLAVIILVRPIYIAFVCFLGTGEIIPYSGWGIAVWGLILLSALLICLFYFKYQNSVDKFLKRIFTIKTK